MKPLAFFKTGLADGLTEIVFEHRHKAYGAYKLRRDYPKRLQQSALLTFATVLLLFIVAVRFSGQHTVLPPVLPADGGIRPIDMAPESFPKQKPKPAAQKPARTDAPFGVVAVDTLTDDVDTTQVVVADAGTGITADSGSATTGSTGGSTGDDTVATADDNAMVITPGILPEFPGGEAALMQYLVRNIRYPERWREEGESGTVVFSLIIDKQGNVAEVTVLKDGVGYGCAERAMETIKAMPRWTPGMQGKRPVNVRFVLPVTFQKSD